MLDAASIRNYLTRARKEIEDHEYTGYYLALKDGEICSPADPNVDTLSFRGAIMRVTPTGSVSSDVFAWLDDRFLLPYVDPKAKAAALSKLDRAIREATPRRVHAA